MRKAGAGPDLDAAEGDVLVLPPPDRRRSGFPRGPRDVPWAAVLISLLGLAAAGVGARVAQFPADPAPSAASASPAAGDAAVAAPDSPTGQADDPGSGTSPTVPIRVILAPAPTPPTVSDRPSSRAAAGASPTSLATTRPSSTTRPSPTTAGRPEPTPSPPTTSPGRTAGCRSTATIASAWPGGFVAQVTLTNTSTTTLSGWSGSFSISVPASVQNSWGAQTGIGGSRVTVIPAPYNASIAPGSTVTFGFQAATPVSGVQLGPLAVNGRTCAAG